MRAHPGTFARDVNVRDATYQDGSISVRTSTSSLSRAVRAYACRAVFLPCGVSSMYARSMHKYAVQQHEE
jgi:hypothetical protein